MLQSGDKKFWIGSGISLIFLLLLFRKIDFNQLTDAFRVMDIRYFLLAIVFVFISYYVRAIRWRYLLIPLKTCSMSNLFASTIVGYMVNGLLPARLGELARAYLLAKKENLEKGAVFASLVLDRLFDGFTVLLILLVTIFTLNLPSGSEIGQKALIIGGYVTLTLYLFVVIFIVFLRIRTEGALRVVSRIFTPFSHKVSAKLVRLLGSFIHGFHLSTKTSHLLALIVSSIVIWLLSIIPIYLILRAFGVFLPFTASMFILVLLVFAIMVPASPGYIGTYHYACFMALTAFNVADGKAMSIALIIHAINFIPVIFAGFFYLWKSKLSLSTLQAEPSGNL
ncbi:MAG: flippase-like domain-containing protein [Desulfuromonadales bacterium]|nr:flippase-like domain-containing protein [Desulfuromonadales bacterium]